jgi:hypothetical protein
MKQREQSREEKRKKIDQKHCHVLSLSPLLLLLLCSPLLSSALLQQHTTFIICYIPVSVASLSNLSSSVSQLPSPVRDQ